LQHPKEAKHAKNTVRLLALSINNLKVIQGESREDFLDFANDVSVSPDNYRLCYPNENSVALESETVGEVETQILPIKHTIIFIDASWRKALKMWHLNPWLHCLTSWHFEHPPANQYHIRHTVQQKSLSTLESVSYVLKKIHNFDDRPLINLLIQMQHHCFQGKKHQK
jgi:DTW domain-containing protein YfiP